MGIKLYFQLASTNIHGKYITILIIKILIYHKNTNVEQDYKNMWLLFQVWGLFALEWWYDLVLVANSTCFWHYIEWDIKHDVLELIAYQHPRTDNAINAF